MANFHASLLTPLLLLGFVPFVTLPTTTVDAPPAPAFAWDYSGWHRDADGDGVDDLIPAIARDGLNAVPRAQDGQLDFRARDTNGIILLDAYVAMRSAPDSGQLASLQSLALDVLADGARPGAWMLGATPQAAMQARHLEGVVMVELEQELRPFNAVARRTTQVEQTATYADDVWNDLGYTGAGVGVAILDTGVDDNHAYLQGSFVAGADTTSSCGLAYTHRINPDDDNAVSVDPLGLGFGLLTFHGTHVAGTLLGDGSTGTGTGVGAGMAPDAELYDVKVLLGIGASCVNSVVNGLAWVEAFNNGLTLWQNTLPDPVPATKKISVVSMSLGGACSDGNDSLSQWVNYIVDTGVTVVIATGNAGQTGCIASPSAAAKAISVGAFDDRNTVSRNDDTMPSFSNCGPSNPSPTDVQRKPDVTAPGVNIQSSQGDATPNGGTLNGEALLSGTSMATPVVSGIVALMLEAKPTLTPEDVKEILRGSATQPASDGARGSRATGSDYHTCWGWGQVNAEAAVATALTY